MAFFGIQEKSIGWAGSVRLSENNPGYILVDTSQLQVRVQTSASLDGYDDSYYLGYVQIITANDQRNHYGRNVEQRWEYSTLPLSDSVSAAERPWYGVDSEKQIGGWRRQYLPKPDVTKVYSPPPDLHNLHSSFSYPMNMSDNFRMRTAKFETLADGRAGPNALNRIERNQNFRLWLVAVEASKVNNLVSYQRLMQIDWGYQIDCSVRLDGASVNLGVSLDRPWHTEKFADLMDPIPPEALNTPAGNEDMDLVYYLDGTRQHVIQHGG
jgi:hypothetical protein